MCYSESTLLHHMAWVLQRKYIVTSHSLSVTAKVQCYIIWPGCYSEGTVLHHMAWVLQLRCSVTSHGLGVTANVQCYITWPYCCTYVTMLHHTGYVLQRSYSVTSHGLSVTENWGYDVASFSFKSECHTVKLRHTCCDCHTELSQCTRSLTSLICYDPSAEGCH